MGRYPSSDVLFRNPTTGIAACCARAASGQAAALPSSVMNSQRLIVAPRGQNHAPHRLTAVRVLERDERGANCDQLFWAGNVGSGSHEPAKTGKAQNQQMFSGCPRKRNLPPDLRTTPAASFSRTPPSRPRASPRSRASACDHSQGVPSGASFSPWRSAFARTDLLRSFVSTRGSRWVSADLEQLFVRHAPSRAVAISWTALAATPLTPALSQRFAQLIQCDWRSCKHQKRDAHSKLHTCRERPRRRAAEHG